MQRKVLILRTENFTPEDELNGRLQELGDDWKVVSANTSIAALGNLPYAQVFYVTTAIVEKA